MKYSVLLLTLCIFSIYPMRRSNRDAYVGIKDHIRTQQEAIEELPDEVRRCSSLDKIPEKRILREKNSNLTQTNNQTSHKEK